MTTSVSYGIVHQPAATPQSAVRANRLRRPNVKNRRRLTFLPERDGTAVASNSVDILSRLRSQGRAVSHQPEAPARNTVLAGDFLAGASGWYIAAASLKHQFV